MKDPVERSNQIVAAYNAKDFARMRTLVHPSLDFSHVNRGFSFNKSEICSACSKCSRRN